MKPHPFPLSLNIGTDIVHLPRIARLVSRPNGYLTRFTRRILSDQEQADFRKRFNLPPGEDVPLESRLYPTHRRLHVQTNANANANGSTGGISAGAGASAGPTSSLSTEMARWLAGRFAAKEAARKAAPGGAASVGWKDVVVLREDEGTTGFRSESGSNTTAAESESASGTGSKGRTKTSVERIREMRRERGSGRPGIVYLDANGGPGRMGKLSISHDGEYVVATVLAAG
ncbi:hypothetical protein SI65_02426 [Aspergillus cristatus]|uniref:Uncharacterized protein n=1 Tax=Aspergillus cristatus TaxID=573508 RepID=A0A1E3BKS9_ASPCR|nr:hypothetical protein SI65_02426 [Aspergillus cristatus]